MSGMFMYSAPVGSEHATHSHAARKFLSWVSADLGMTEPQLGWALLVDHGYGPDLRDRHGRLLQLRPRKLAGWWSHIEPDTIYIRADMDWAETMRSVGHEAFHRFEYLAGWPASEASAEAYAEAAVDRRYRRTDR